MVFINCSYCNEPLCIINYKLILSGKMMIRNYKEKCSSCHVTLDFYWHENSDQIFDEEKIDQVNRIFCPSYNAIGGDKDDKN